MIKKLISTIIFIPFLLACRLTSSAATEPPATKPEPVKPVSTPTPATVGLTLHEAWRQAQPAVQAWAADARPGEEWVYRRDLTPDGRCRHWVAPLGSAAQHKVADLDIQDGQVDLKPREVWGQKALLARVLDTAFSVETTLDSPAAAARALAWVEAQGLKQDKTRARSLALRSDPNSLNTCRAAAAPAYIIGLIHPDGTLCLGPASGAVIYSSLAEK